MLKQMTAFQIIHYTSLRCKLGFRMLSFYVLQADMY